MKCCNLIELSLDEVSCLKLLLSEKIKEKGRQIFIYEKEPSKITPECEKFLLNHLKKSKKEYEELLKKLERKKESYEM